MNSYSLRGNLVKSYCASGSEENYTELEQLSPTPAVCALSIARPFSHGTARYFVCKVFSAAFHHAERALRVTSSLTAESPTIKKL
jgi:hypothetical protein